MIQKKPTKAYHIGFHTLYDNEDAKPSPLADIKPRRRVAKLKEKAPWHESEYKEQVKVHVWMEKKGIIHHHSPNGGKRSPAEAAKFKNMGVSAGFPDLYIPYARKGCHGLFLELKIKEGGKLSNNQLWWGEFLIKEGYAWHCAKGAEEAISIICNYFEITKHGRF